MKKIIICLYAFVTFSYQIHATEWKNQWMDAVRCCNEKEYVQAEVFFNQAIDLMEKGGDLEHPQVYVDRARLNILLDKFPESLPDLDKALESSYLAGNEKQRALISRILARSKLQMADGVLEDLKVFGDAYAPKIEQSEKKLFMRNVPNCDCFKKIMTCYFIHSGICKSKKDVHMLKSGTCIVDKNCGCGCKEMEEGLEQQQQKVCDACGETISTLKNPQCAFDGCKMWCDANTLTCTAWCGKAFKSAPCYAACLGAVYLVQQGCYWCCEGGNYYEKCVKPFGHVTDYIKEPCDPYWD